MHRLIQGSCLVLGIVLTVTGNALAENTESGEVFHNAVIEQVKVQLPPRLEMRLPSEIPIVGLEESHQYHIQVTSSATEPSLMVSLFTCEDNSLACLVGSFSASDRRSHSANQELENHQTFGAKITLSPEIKGYFIEGNSQNSSHSLSSVMWEQEGVIYHARFLPQKRQELLYMAYSMVQGEPIIGERVVVEQPTEEVLASSPSTIVNSQIPEDLAFLREQSELPEQVTLNGNTAQEQVLDSEEGNETNEATEVEDQNDENPESCNDPDDSSNTSALIDELDPIEIVVLDETVRVMGSTVFSREEIEDFFDNLDNNDNSEGRIELNRQLEELEQEERTENWYQEFSKTVAAGITLLYLEKGYLTSRASFNSDDSDAIEVSEGSISQIQIEGRERLNLSYLCSRILLGIGIPLNTNQLEEQLRLLRSNPRLENIDVTLEKSGTTGKSILVVTITEANPFFSRFSIDNYSPPSVGSERIGIQLGSINLTGVGDILAASYYHSTTSGSDALNFSYEIPLNPMEGTLSLRIAPNWTEITQEPFNALNIQGQKDQYEIVYRQPLVRTLSEELALSLGFLHQEGQTFVFDQPTRFGEGPNEDGVSRTSVFQFGQEYIRRDPSGAWLFSSKLNFGVGLFDATNNSGSVPDGYFFSWLGQAQRAQRLSDDHLLVISADLQLTPDPLLPAHQFIIGGGQSVRGYRQNARSGDNGLRFSIENRITLVRDGEADSVFEIIPFLDLGWVWNASGNPNELSDQTFLMGVGLGLLWHLENIDDLSLSLNFGIPLFDLDDRGTNAQDDGIYFRIIYQPKGLEPDK